MELSNWGRRKHKLNKSSNEYLRVSSVFFFWPSASLDGYGRVTMIVLVVNYNR